MIYRQYLLLEKFAEKQSVPQLSKSPQIEQVPNNNEDFSDETDQEISDDGSDVSDVSDQEISDEEGSDGVDNTEGDPESYLVAYKKFFLIQKLNELKGKLEEKGLGLSELNTILLFVNDLDYDTLLLLSARVLDMIKSYIKGKSNGKNKTK